MLTDTQFVMLTVYGDSYYIFEALRAGAIGYLSKKTPCDQLIHSLRQVCDGGSPMSGHIARKVVQFFSEGFICAFGLGELVGTGTAGAGIAGQGMPV